jgi:conjugation system TraG family ATPase
MKEAIALEKLFPIYKVENDCILSRRGDVTVAFQVMLPEIFTLSDQEYEGFHQTLVKSIKTLPSNSVFHKQDWFLTRKFAAQFEDKVLSFLSHSSDRFFNERPFLAHHCYLMVTLLSDHKETTSLTSSLLKGHLSPKNVSDAIRLQEFLDCVGQFERILQDSGYISLKRICENELTGDRYRAGLLEQYCFIQPPETAPTIKDISFKDGVSIGNDQCKFFSLADAEDLPGLCGSRINYDRYSTDKTKFSIGFASSLGQLLSCNHILNQYIFLQDVPKTLKKFESKRLRLQSLSTYSRENAISRDATNDFLNETITAQRLPVKAHFNVMVWSDDKKELKEIKTN